MSRLHNLHAAIAALSLAVMAAPEEPASPGMACVAASVLLFAVIAVPPAEKDE